MPGQIGGRENKSSNNLVLVVYYQQGRQGEMESILVVSGGELDIHRENEMDFQYPSDRVDSEGYELGRLRRGRRTCAGVARLEE